MNLRMICLSLLSLLILTFTATQPAAAFNILGDACNGAGSNGPTCQQNKSQNGSSTNPVVDTIHEAVNLIAALAGIIAIFTIVYSGARFILSGDNPEGRKQAREILQNALIGLVIIAFAWLIITMITNVLV
jgi:cytochrome bd-type quinol oxidase subunit 2